MDGKLEMKSWIGLCTILWGDSGPFVEQRSDVTCLQ